MDGITVSFSSDAWELILPLIMMGLDILTGFINAWKDKNIQSSKMRSGLVKKFGEVVVIVISDLFVHGFGIPKQVMDGIIIYIVLMECVSILENLNKMGVIVPKKITDVLNNKITEIGGKNGKDGE